MMKIYSVNDREFAPYGKVLQGYQTEKLLQAMKQIPLPEQGTAYECSIPALEEAADSAEFQNRGFGGLTVQVGMCWGKNTKLNCMEYHRSSELNIGTDAFILLLGREDEIENHQLDTSKVKAFLVPAGTLVEVYATTLHYAPCHVSEEIGFRVAVILPKGTNEAMPQIKANNMEDQMLRAANKWLLAHPEAPEAAQGAYIGLTGENIDIMNA